MGSTLKAACSCGYTCSVSCASSRREHLKKFYYPHQCNQCHEVVSVDILNTPHSCPRCGGHDIQRYGVAIPEIPYGWWHRLIARITGAQKHHDDALDTLNASKVGTSYCYAHHTTYGITKAAYQCPVCQQQSLKFTLSQLTD